MLIATEFNPQLDPNPYDLVTLSLAMITLVAVFCLR
jgi:hypothetical protein